MTDKQTPPEETPKTPPQEVAPIETQHEITLNGKTLKYTVTTGRMPLKNEKDEIQAQIFFMAYTLDGVENKAKRPVVFSFNGGPGSSSVWLHLGALGPKRVKMQDEGWMPPPPYELVDNEHTWLDVADLVFIDPVGTGYSRATDPDKAKEYWNVENDIKSVGEFIRLYLTRYQRWTSPLFLAGESYGTIRAAGLAGHLIDRGIAFNGIILISTVLNQQTNRFNRGNDLPFTLFLPTYTATAWYHKKLPDALQQKPLAEVLAEVETWALGEYMVALAKGDRLTEKERTNITRKLARYTGLSTTYIEQSNLRINIFHFDKELLRDQKRTVGRMDSRFKGRDALAVTERPDFDPSFNAVIPPYTAMFYDYLRGALGYESDLNYEILSFNVNLSWEWEHGKYTDTSEALRSALAKNYFMKVFVGMGYYDLATPHFAAHYAINHMDIDPELRDNFTTHTYEAGHMFYLDVNSLAKLKGDVVAFVGQAVVK